MEPSKIVDGIEAFISNPWVDLAVGLLLVVTAYLMNQNWVHWLIIFAWALMVFSVFRTLSNQELVARLLWTMLFAAVCGLFLYYTLWIRKNPGAVAETSPSIEPSQLGTPPPERHGSTAVTSSGGELHLRVGQMKGFDRAFDVSGTGKVNSQIDSIIGPNSPSVRPPSPIAPDPKKLKTIKSRVRELNGQIFDFLAQRQKNEPPEKTSEMEKLFRRSDKESVEAFTKAFVEQGEITQQYANETSTMFSQQFEARMAAIRDELAGVGLKSAKLDEVLADDLRLAFEIQEAAEELQKLALKIDAIEEGPSLASDGLIINDVIRSVYPDMKLDFRISNVAPREISISRLFLMILKIETGDSPVGKQQISDKATIELTAELREGDVLQAPLALNVKEGENDRFTVNFYWAGQPQSFGHWYTALPALETSSGFVQGPLVRIHMQQAIWPTSAEHAGHSPSWDVPEGAVTPAVNWNDAAKRAIPFDNSRKTQRKQTR